VDRLFVRVVDTQRKERVINVLQIVEVRYEIDSWEVWLTKGDPVRLAPEEAEKLLKRLLDADTKKAGSD
jgi:L-lysine 2,3-aminomutase